MMTDRRKIIHVVPDHAIPQRRVGGWASYSIYVRKMVSLYAISFALWYGIYHVVRWLLR